MDKNDNNIEKEIKTKKFKKLVKEVEKEIKKGKKPIKSIKAKPKEGGCNDGGYINV